jgi:hypothetical protein
MPAGIEILFSFPETAPLSSTITFWGISINNGVPTDSRSNGRPEKVKKFYPQRLLDNGLIFRISS